MHIPSDTELIRSVQRGDIFAFELLVKRYQKPLVHFAYRFLKSEQEAEEVAQDAFVRLYKTIDRVDDSRKFSTYLFEITKNAAISALRKKKQTVPLETIVEHAADESLYETFVQKERGSRVRQAIRRMEKKYRDIIHLYYFEDLSYEQISSALRLPINTVRTHLRRAKEDLKKRIRHEI